MPLDQAPPASDLLVQTTSSQTTTSSSSAGVSAVPAGALSPYAGNTAPSGWLLCDGSNVSRSTYSALFAIIGTTYGAGDGSTTFGLPDLQGRTVFGLAGATGHVDVKTLAATDGVAIGSRRPKHKHTVVQPTISSPSITVAQPTINITDPTHAHGLTVTNAGQVTIAGGGGGGSATDASEAKSSSTTFAIAAAATGITATASGGSASLSSAPVATSGSVGPQTGAEPVDSTPYIVMPWIIKT